MAYSEYEYMNELYHHGILGQKWGVRRFQNKDGSLTAAGRKRYSVETIKNAAARATNTLKKLASASRAKVRIVISDRKKKRETAESELEKDKHLSEEEKASIIASGDPDKILAYQNEMSLSELAQALDRANKIKNLKNMSAEKAAQEEKYKKEHGAMATMGKIIDGTINAMNTAGKAKDAFDNLSKWWGGNKKEKADVPLTVEDAMKRGLDKLTMKELTNLRDAEKIRDTIRSKYDKLTSDDSDSASSTENRKKSKTKKTDTKDESSESKDISGDNASKSKTDKNDDRSESKDTSIDDTPKSEKSGEKEGLKDYSSWAKKLEGINESRTINSSNDRENERVKDLLGERYRLRNEIKNKEPDPDKTAMYRKAIESGRRRLEELKDAQDDLSLDPSLRYKRNLDPSVLQRKISEIEGRLDRAIAKNPSLRLEEVEEELDRIDASKALEEAIEEEEERQRRKKMRHSEPPMNELYHHGILGQKWGVRRFQNEDGSLTSVGKKRYLENRVLRVQKKVRDAEQQITRRKEAKSKYQARVRKLTAKTHKLDIKYGKELQKINYGVKNDTKKLSKLDRKRSRSIMKTSEIISKIDKLDRNIDRYQMAINNGKKYLSKAEKLYNSGDGVFYMTIDLVNQNA